VKRAWAAWLALAVPAVAVAAEGGASEPGLTHRMMLLVLELGCILFAARFGRILFERLTFPGVLGELAAGALIGPYLLGGLPLPGLAQGLFPSTGSFPVSPELYGICSVAAVVLMFMVGLETDLRLFLRFSVAGGLVGVGGVLFSFVLGDLTAVWFLRTLFDRPAGFLTPACLFLGVLSTATSVGITARVLSERRKLDSPEGVTILAGAVIDDVLGIVLLAVVAGLITAGGHSGDVQWGRIGGIAAKAIGVWLAATFLGLRLARRIGGLLKGFKQQSAIAVMSLGLALILAGLFEEAGLAMIIGAYVAGLSLSRTDIRAAVREKLEPVFELLVPVFFCVMGMMVDFRTFLSGRILLFGAGFTIVAILAKLLGCGAAALFCGFNRRGAFRIGVGMVPRGEVALIIAGIGLASGALPRDLFGVAVLMTVFTTLPAPAALDRLLHTGGEGTRQPLPPEEHTELVFDFPSPEVTELLARSLVQAFEQEGFFVHALERRRKVYQLFKDDMTLSMEYDDSTIRFLCQPDEIGIVNTAVYEVLHEFEKVVKGLRRPVDPRLIRGQMKREEASGGRMLDLARYLAPHRLLPRLKARTKDEALQELMAPLVAEGVVKNPKEALRALRDREAVMSTGLEDGIAIPHAKTDAVDRLVCAVGLKPEGLEFDALDGAPTTILVLELAPRDAVAPHIQFMATVSHALNAPTRRRLLASKTPADMLRVLTGSPPVNGG
jgi:Kef-type K+ transport system membrane component KefB/mannitol/fructose-specific phosphotransferase system IIA component (Ntr-type)